jgi:hypothetical protein
MVEKHWLGAERGYLSYSHRAGDGAIVLCEPQQAPRPPPITPTARVRQPALAEHKEACLWQLVAQRAIAESWRSSVRASRYGFRCATALNVNVGPEQSSAAKRGSADSKLTSPATQPNSRVSLPPAVQCHFGSAPYADRLCVGRRRLFPATSLWPWGHLPIPPSQHPHTPVGKQNGITGLSRFAPWLSTIQIETLPPLRSARPQDRGD